MMMQDQLWKNLDDRESEAIAGGQNVFLVLLFVNRSRSNTGSNAVTRETSFSDRVRRADKITDYQIYR